VDIAPIGHLVEARLTIRPVQAAVWVLVGTRTRLERDSVAQLIANTVVAAARPLIRVRLDETDGNVELVEDDRGDNMSRARGTLALKHASLGPWLGGLYRAVLTEILSGGGSQNG
jgi:hypothetical protein